MQRFAFVLLLAATAAHAQAPDTLRSPVDELYLQYGSTLDATDEWLFVGAQAFSNGRDAGSTEARRSDPYGSVFTYRLGAGAPVLTDRLFPDDFGHADCFSWALDVRGDIAAIGAECETPDPMTTPLGAVYVYRYIGTEWTRVAKLTSRDIPNSNSSYFGYRVALGDGYLVVADDDAGAVVFRAQGDSWAYETTLSPGIGVASVSTAEDASGSVIVIGDPYIAGPGGARQGAVYVFSQDNGVWTETAHLLCPGSGAGSDCGYEMQGGGGQVVVAADRGVHPLNHQDGVWSLGASLLPSGRVPDEITRWGPTVVATSGPAQSGRVPLYLFEDTGDTWSTQTRSVERLMPQFFAGPKHMVSANSTSVFSGITYSDARVLIDPIRRSTAAEAPPAAAALNLTLAPNPAAAEARIRFETTAPGDARLVVVDALGRLVVDRSLGELGAGAHDVPLGLGRVAAGVYVVRLDAGGASATRRLVVR